MADDFNRGTGPGTPMPLDDFDPNPPRWPKVVGWISMIFGALGVLCVSCSVAWLFTAKDLMKGNPQIDVNNLPPVMHISPLMAVQLGVGAVSSILLIAAGGLTLGRQGLGRILHLIWGILALVNGLFGFFVQYQQQMAMAAWVKDNPDSVFSKNQSPANLYIGLGCGALFLLWPIFCLVWFGLVKRRAEQMLRHDGAPPEVPA
jgi:hypothetical protein